MRGNYEQLVKAHMAQPGGAAGGAGGERAFVPSEIKFEAFKLLMDKLFVSFNDQVKQLLADIFIRSIYIFPCRCKIKL